MTSATRRIRRRTLRVLSILLLGASPVAVHAQDPAPDPGRPPAEGREKPGTEARPAGEVAPAGKPATESDPAGDTVLPAVGASAPEPGGAPAPAPYEPGYHALAEVRAMLGGWVSTAPCTIESLTLVAEGQELDVPAIQWGAAGPVPLAERSTVFLLGGIDGVSLAGGEAVLAVTSALLAEPPRADLAFVSIPWVAVQALVETGAGGPANGLCGAPDDDDGDGALDEDGPDDADNDGEILEMLIEDPDGPWTFSTDPRFLTRARQGDSPRFRRVLEGKDDDRDGRYNEDPRGGACLDRNFPVGWRGPWTDPASGPYPLSEPAARALADLVLSRRTVSVLVFQGNHGSLATPGGFESVPWPPGADLLDFEVITAAFTRATRRAQEATLRLERARGRAAHGAALDWLYAVPGALALEVGVWGPDVEAPPEPGEVALSDALFGAPERPAALGAGTPPSLLDLAWARWLDNTRGGIGFENWHPVTLDDGTRVRIGGWSPFARLNPPADSLPDALAGLPAFVKELARSLPSLALDLDQVERDGEICRIRARVTNEGALSTGLWPTGRRPGTPSELVSGGCVVELDLPPGAQLLAGEARSALGRLSGGSSSRELSWVVLAAPGSVVSITVRSAWGLPLVREVQP